MHRYRYPETSFRRGRSQSSRGEAVFECRPQSTGNPQNRLQRARWTGDHPGSFRHHSVEDELDVPRLVSRAVLHRRDGAHQPRTPAALAQDCYQPVFLTRVSLAGKLDLDSVGRRQLLGVFPKLVSKRVRKKRAIEEPRLVRKQLRCCRVGVTDPRQSGRTPASGADNRVPLRAARRAAR
jgi:hypothetical protein